MTGNMFLQKKKALFKGKSKADAGPELRRNITDEFIFYEIIFRSFNLKRNWKL